MALAIFGITNSSLNLAATLVLLFLVVLWLALIVYTFLDARRRISDPFLVACATIASFFPYVGTMVYMIVRPPEYLEDAHERELEIRASELRVRQLREQTCPNCEYPVEKNYLRCPNCQRRLKDPCPTCSEPVDPRWGLCPYCETSLSGERTRQPRRRGPEEQGTSETQPKRRSRKKARPAGEAEGERGKTGERSSSGSGSSSSSTQRRSKSSGSRKSSSARSASKEAPTSEQDQRSPSREPDPDPRQA